MPRWENFEAWFTAQYGLRPSDKSMFELEEIARCARGQANNAEATLRRVELWERRRDAALKGASAAADIASWRCYLRESA